MSTENNDIVSDKFVGINEYVWKKENRYKKVASHVKDNTHLIETVYDAAFKIDEKYHVILNILLFRPEINAIDIVNGVVDEKEKRKEYNIGKKRIVDKKYKKINRMIKDLQDIGLIETIEGKEKPIGNFKKTSSVYKLSLNGIFYVLLNYYAFPTNPLLVTLSNNYPDNLLFELFVDAYFEKGSIKEIGRYISYLIIPFLISICKRIVHHMEMLSVPSNSLIDCHMPEQLFSWPKSGINSISKFNKFNWNNLKGYLKEEFSWTWIHQAKITESFDENKIAIKSNETNITSVIRIYEKEGKAVLWINGKRHEIFKVDEISEDTLGISGKSFSHSKSVNNSFQNWLNQELLILLFKIRTVNCFSGVDQKHLEDTINQTLLKDSKFKKAVENMIDMLRIKE